MTTGPTPGTPATPGTSGGEDAFEVLKKMINEAEPDYQKAVGGNKAAGTRVRKAMQDIKAQAQAIRVKVLETRTQAP